MNDQPRLALSEPETFLDQDAVHQIFTELRRDDPVAWCPESDGGLGFWSITKYDAIQSISKNPKVFSSDRLLGGITLESAEMRRRRKSLENASKDEVSGGGSIITSGSSMIMMDPPTHTQHRRMVAPGFTPGRLNALVPEIRTRCVEILENIAGRGECEFVSAVAAELPIQMLAELLDVEQEDRKKLFEWSNIMIGGDDPDMRIGRDEVMSVFGELFQYSLALRTSRQENPGDDLISMLVNTEMNGKPMELADYVSAFILLVVAGNETTRNSISGGVLALSQHPEERQKLIDDPSLIPDAIDAVSYTHLTLPTILLV